MQHGMNKYNNSWTFSMLLICPWGHLVGQAQYQYNEEYSDLQTQLDIDFQPLKICGHLSWVPLHPDYLAKLCCHLCSHTAGNNSESKSTERMIAWFSPSRCLGILRQWVTTSTRIEVRLQQSSVAFTTDQRAGLLWVSINYSLVLNPQYALSLQEIGTGRNRRLRSFW